jgi:hypothetical protein
MSEEKNASRKLNFGTPSEQAAARQQYTQGQTRSNPLYGTNVWNPNAYLPNMPVSANPTITEPLPQGSFIDPKYPSAQNAIRASDIEEFRNNPAAYVAANAPELVQEQTLLDRGKSMLANLFDYTDDADLAVLGVPLGPVESVWDGTLRHMVGFYDLLSIGFGGLLSVAPGGVDPISYDALSGGKSVGEVLNGEMVPGSAPSPGQIAIASIGIEAKRIREGNARVSDILLANPATGPFILAALAADTSPVQADGFDLLNQQQRDTAFGSGWEQWMTGVTDAGLMFADPLIGVGVGMKVARAGMLGGKTDKLTSIGVGVGLTNATDEVLGVVKYPQRMDEVVAVAIQRGEAQKAMQNGSVVDRLMVGDRAPSEAPYMPVRVTADKRPESFENPLAQLVWNIAEYGDDGQKVWDAKRIESIPEIAQLDNKGTISALLHQAPDPIIISLFLQTMQGTPGAAQKLMALRPAIADTALRVKHDRLSLLRGTEPQKVAEARDGLARDRQNATEALKNVEEQRRRIRPDLDVNKIADPQDKALFVGLGDRAAVLEQNLAEVTFLQQALENGRRIDPLDVTQPFYRETDANIVFNDLMDQNTLIGKAVGDAIEEASADIGLNGAMFGKPKNFLYKENMLSTLARGSRARRGEAGYQYAMEGTRVIPRKVQYGTHIDEAGNRLPLTRWEGVWTASQFEGTGRLARNMRVWRWLGEETPSGYIGLKGAGTVGSENEFTAATNLGVYKGDPWIVEREVIRADGTKAIESVSVGGVERRKEMFNEFYSALNDPNQDSLTALQKVEGMIAEDLALAYGLEPEKMMQYIASAGRIRNKTMEHVRKTGYFVDPDTGDIEIAPYLKSQLANGTYMLNFQNMEKTLRKQTANDGGKRLRSIMDTSGHYAAEADKFFQNIWRPLALMRLSYTQRNVFEGMLRAMAYNASLAPLTWPVQATVNGTRNAIVKRTMGRKIAAAEKAIKDSDFNAYWDNYTVASREQMSLVGAIEIIRKEGAAPDFAIMRKSEDGTVAWEYLSEADYTKRLEKANDTVRAADEALKANADKFTAAIKGTKFGKWREAEITDLSAELAKRQQKLDIWAELINETGINGKVVELNDVAESIRGVQNILEEAYVLDAKLARIKYRPIEAMADYREMAGRQKRIGSGTSMGPDGNYYGDAFTSPYEQLNRGLLSSDNTVKQSLSVDATAWGNFFQRLTMKTNVKVAYAESPQKWHAGMADAIEDASSNALIRQLVANDWDVEKAAAWMMSDSQEAKDFTRSVENLFSDEGLSPALREPKEAAEEVVEGTRKRLKPFSETAEAGSQRYTRYDVDALTEYVYGVSDRARAQLMNRPEFYEMLRRRSYEKTPANAAAARVAGRPVRSITEADVSAVTRNMSDADRDALGFIQGSEVIQGGMDSVVGLWQKFVGKMFKGLGTIPEDAVVRGPFYNTRFKAARNDLIKSYWLERNVDIKTVERANKDYYKAQSKTKAGAVQEGTISHPPFEIPAKDLSRLEYLANRRALQDTREYMYTIERRTNLGKNGEWLFPFISASQNSVTVAGKLLYKEPWLAPMVADLWRMPNRVGFEDEEGNLQIAMPFPFIRDWLKDHPEVPFLGGVIDSTDTIKISKDGLNVFMPDTGFGIAPRPVPWMQVSASELMKAGAFPVETPQVLRSLMGDAEGDQFYQMVKDYVFGTQGSMSEKTGSYDLLAPPVLQRFLQMKDELDAGYGYQYALQRATEMMRWKAGERDTEPTADEIGQRTTNMFWFQLLGNVGMPTPLTPYPILTRPQVGSATEELMDIYQKLKQTDPENASLNMYNMFGDWALEAANTKITSNVGGADPNMAAASDIKTFDPLIREVTNAVSPENYDLIGIIVNNRSPEFDYNQSAYDFEKATTIAGTNRKYREVQSPQESQEERERVVGWTMYRKGMDFLDAQLASRGLKSYEATAAMDLKAAKDRMIANMANNQELQGWWIAYQDLGGNRTSSAIRVVELAVSNPQFVEEMTRAGKTGLIDAMNTYVQARRYVIQTLTSTGTSINDPQNAALKQGWANIRQGLKADERWTAIADRYLATDDNPQFPGNFMPNEFAMATVSGAVNG